MEQTFRLNVVAANIPFISTQYGRSVLMKDGADTHYISTNTYGGQSSDLDFGIPQVLYFHNVFPTSRGLTSLGFDALTLPTPTPAREAHHIRTCFDERFIYLPNSLGNYIWKDSKWLNIGGWASSAPVTVTHLHKATYICHEYEGVQKLNESNYQLVPVQLKGITMGEIKGITHANNYLIAYTKDTIHWSSPIEIENLEPGMETTAGSIIPLHVRGSIVICLPTPKGFIIYTTVNAVRATYTGDIRYPFTFMEIVNSGGVDSNEKITHENNHDTHYLLSNKGIQAIGKMEGEATQLFPEANEFLTGHYFEDYIGATGKIDHSNLSEVWSSESQTWAEVESGYNQLKQIYHKEELVKKIAVISNRWLVISYGLTSLTHAIVFDIALKRWGKIRISHVDCFEVDHASPTSYLQEANHSIGFLLSDGRIKTVNLEQQKEANDSVVIFGRIQYKRGNVITLHSVELENVFPKEATLEILSSLDGKTWQPETYPMKQIETKNLTRWITRLTAINHCIKFSGNFDIVSIVGTATVGGSR